MTLCQSDFIKINVCHIVYIDIYKSSVNYMNIYFLVLKDLICIFKKPIVEYK